MADRQTDERRYEATARSEQSEPLADELPMHLLAAGIPLTLLLDLAENFGPPSTQILESEHEPAYADPSAPAGDWLAHLAPSADEPSSRDVQSRSPVPSARTAPDETDPASLTV